MTGLDRLKQRLYRPGPLVAIFGAVLLLLAGFIMYLVHSRPASSPAVVESPIILRASVPDDGNSTRAYEEILATMLEEQVKQVDLALLETLRKTGVDMQRLELTDVQVRQHNGQIYHFQELRIPGIKDRSKFLLALQEGLAQRAPGAFLVGDGTEVVGVDIDNVQTHRIVLDITAPAPVYPSTPGPKLVIVIDDVGENLRVLKGLLKLDIPLVYAVWPVSSHTDESARLIRESGSDLILHFPMEPKGYPKVDPGPGALFTSMSAGDIRKTVDANVPMVPGAIGANNHMGSRFTESRTGMKTALSALKDKGLFFLDSMTTPKSAGRKIADKVGIAYYERDVFLDNIKVVPSIILQLRKAERIAKRRGKAIAIGHNYATTLSALRQWADQRDKSVQVIPISSLRPE